MKFWTVPREWPGGTVFIVAGGASVLEHDLEQLRGRRVIVINSSVHAVPWADILYFGDWRWWNEPENRAAVAAFAGRVVTTSQMVRDPKVLVCRKIKPPGLAAAADSLTQKWTSFTAATNLAAHLVGPGGTVVWLGADGRPAADGRVWHHKPHRWAPQPQRYERHRADIAAMVEPLRARGVTLFNASPGSAYADLWPVISLHEALALERSVRLEAGSRSAECGVLGTTYSRGRSCARPRRNTSVWLETPWPELYEDLDIAFVLRQAPAAHAAEEHGAAAGRALVAAGADARGQRSPTAAT